MKTSESAQLVAGTNRVAEGPPRAVVYVTRSIRQGSVRLKFKLEGASIGSVDAAHGVGTVICLASPLVGAVETHKEVGIVYVTLKPDAVAVKDLMDRFGKIIGEAAGVATGHTMVVDKTPKRRSS